MPGQMKVPGPDHPITIEPAERHVVVRAGERVIAKTDNAVTLAEANYPPVFYIPLEDVDPSVLKPSETHTYCPYKGDASYYGLALPEGDIDDAIWFYPQPYPSVAEIAGRVAFYAHKVDIQT